MKAECFYQTEQPHAVPLELVFIESFTHLVESLSLAEKNCFESQQFKAKTGELAVLSNSEGQVVKIYLGVEKNNIAQAIAHAALKCPPGMYLLKDNLNPKDLMTWGLAQYRYDRYKKQDLKPRILCLKERDKTDVLNLVDAVFSIRDLINCPPNDLGPKELADAAAKLAKTFGAECHEWVGDVLLKENFPAIHMVGRASASQPRLITLTWGKSNHPLVTLIGKGVCFDSGGLDIKPSSGMRLMKKDMGGAAQVLGLAQWIMSEKLPIRLQVYIPAVENAIGPAAFRPGDVITMRNGLTVEIDNTDAEGRLILADALAKACEEKPELIIDFSTLTGAARIAVGTEISAMFCNNEQLAQDLLQASQETKDPLWRMPLYEGYESLLDSNIADLSNCQSSPFAGAIVAALFLQRFLGKDIPWAHFDIMSWNTSSKPGKPEGGEAMGIRAVAAYLKKRFM